MIDFYNEDCVSGLKQYKDKYFDLAIVDPPYGSKSDAINTDDCIRGEQKAPRTKYHNFKDEAPTSDYWDELFRVSKNQIVWGANFFFDPRLKGGYICWDKKGTCFGRAELAFCSKINSVNVFEYTWNGMIQERMDNKEIRIHPTQKPIDLYKWLLTTYANKGDKILDTHVGSGSSLIACYELGYDAIGYEIDKIFYDKAKKRLSDYMSQISLFDYIGR